MFKIRERIRDYKLKREFNKYDRLAETWRRRSESAKEMASFYEIRADEVVKTTNRLRHADETSSFGFAGEL